MLGFVPFNLIANREGFSTHLEDGCVTWGIRILSREEGHPLICSYRDLGDDPVAYDPGHGDDMPLVEGHKGYFFFMEGVQGRVQSREETGLEADATRRNAIQFRNERLDDYLAVMLPREVPVLNVVVGGGFETLQRIIMGIEKKQVFVVVEGSGGVADLVARALAKGTAR